MGAGNVGCCEKNTSLKNTEVCIQSVTYRDNSEEFCFTPNSLPISETQHDFKLINMTKRKKQLRKLRNFSILSLSLLNCTSEEKTLIISPTGLLDSRRSVRDGYTFFGYKYKLSGVVLNDIKLHLKDSEKCPNVPGRYFMIYYDITHSSYWIKDLGKGAGVFIKLDFPLIMKDGIIVNIGNSYLQFNFKIKIPSNPEVEIRKLGDDNYRV